MIGQGRHPLAAIGVAHLVPRVSAALSRIILACHNLYGGQRQLYAIKSVCPLTDLTEQGVQPLTSDYLQAAGRALCPCPCGRFERVWHSAALRAVHRA